MPTQSGRSTDQGGIGMAHAGSLVGVELPYLCGCSVGWQGDGQKPNQTVHTHNPKKKLDNAFHLRKEIGWLRDKMKARAKATSRNLQSVNCVEGQTTQKQLQYSWRSVSESNRCKQTRCKRSGSTGCTAKYAWQMIAIGSMGQVV